MTPLFSPNVRKACAAFMSKREYMRYFPDEDYESNRQWCIGKPLHKVHLLYKKFCDEVRKKD